MTSRVAIAYSFHDEDWLGGKNYFASLFHAIDLLKPSDLRLVFVTGKKIRTSLPQEFPFLEVIRTAWLDRGHPAWLLRQVGLRRWDSDPLFAHFLRRHHIDLLSHSNQLGPRSGLKTMEWLYDFQFMHLPEYWQPKHISWAEQRYSAACRNCDALIVSSHNARADLKQFAPWSIVPAHVLQFVSNPPSLRGIASQEEIRGRYGLPEEYFFLPNQFWTNKNHRLVIDAARVLRERGIEATIVCTGKQYDGRRPEYFPELVRYVEEQGLTAQFRILGVVPYRDTQSLMAHSRAVINPSRFEGWSTTVEEAKTLHKRLLLSNIPVHREQSPDLGRFFSPDAPGELAQLMQETLAEPRQAASPDEIERSYRRRLERFGTTYLQIVRSTLGLASSASAAVAPDRRESP